MEQTTPASVPGPCPVCGAVSLAPVQQRSTLLAVCDVLVLKALEKLGNYIVRAERARYNLMRSKPRYEAHTLWPGSDEMVAKALKGAWDVVPLLLDTHGCCGVTGLQVTAMLNSYVHDLAITGTHHDIAELQYRFETELGLPVFDRAEHDHG